MDFICTVVNNGEDTYFWSNIWLPLERLFDIVGEIGTRLMGI